MAARTNKRVSKGYYKDLNDVSTADFVNNGTLAKKGRFYEIERVQMIELAVYQTWHI